MLVIIATDRISAFDYVLGSGIPDKGRILTQLSAFWFEHLRDIVPNHVITLDPSQYPAPARACADLLRGRSMLVQRTSARANRVRRTRLPGRVRVEGVHADRGGVRHRAAARTAGVGSAAGANLHAGHQGGVGP